MAEWLFTLLVLAGLVGVGALLFGGWIVYTILKVLFRVIGTIFNLRRGPAPGRKLAGPLYDCPRASCRASNPAGAQFCRRCGQALAPDQRRPGLLEQLGVSAAHRQRRSRHA